MSLKQKAMLCENGCFRKTERKLLKIQSAETRELVVCGHR